MTSNTNEITVSRGLAELKTLDSRINRVINDAIFATYTLGGKLPSEFKSVDEVEKQSKSDLQSIKDLIKRRNDIKSAIVTSNAITEIDVAGVKMTVAQAIERKSSIEYEQSLLFSMRKTYTKVTNHIDRVNEQVKERLDEHLKTLLGKDGAVNTQVNEQIVKAFNADNEAKMIDPIGLKKQIEELTESIESFEQEVDFSLNESNVITRIIV